MVRAPRWASMRLKRPSPAPTSRTSLPCTLPHSFSMTASSSNVRLGSPWCMKRMYSDAKACQPLSSFAAGIGIWFVTKGGHYARVG